jgi:anti-sigma B factor antagonist
MNITEQERDGITIYDLDGRIDTEGALDLEMTLQAAAAAGKNKMVLNMAQVVYVSSAGLRTLADILTRNREAAGDLKLVRLNRKVMRVFRIIGFDKFFSIYDSVETALTDF